MVETAHRQPLIAAHRGGAGLWPENSLTAFRQSVLMPIDLIEFDVHRSEDGTIVVFHDPVLDRTTNGTGPLYTRPLVELRSLRLKGGTDDTIPLLDEVIATAKPTAVNLRLELKRRADGERYPGIEAEVIQRLRDTGMFERTLFTSFDWGMLLKIKELTSPRGTVALVRAPAIATPAALDQTCAEAKAMGLDELGLPMAHATPQVFDHVRGAGLRCGGYGVISQEQTRLAFDQHLSVFTTDRPDWAIEERDRRAHSAP